MAFGGATTDQRASYQKAAYLGFKHGSSAADLGTPIVCNNVIAGSGSNLTALLTSANNLLPYMETYNIHTYDPVDSYEAIFAPARRVAQLNVPLWLTESGIHLQVGPGPWGDMSVRDDWRQATFVAPSFVVSFFAGHWFC